MRVVEVERLREDLTDYTADVFASLTRSGWQERAGWYLHGLMLDGRRKSIQPMAARLGGAVHEQALNHFVTNSPWRVEPVRARIAELIDEAAAPVAWAIDDTPGCGTASPCVARQYTGTAGKVTNCQIAVSVSMVTDTASCPVDWWLFVPEAWDPTSPKATPPTNAEPPLTQNRFPRSSRSHRTASRPRQGPPPHSTSSHRHRKRRRPPALPTPTAGPTPGRCRLSTAD
jgi:hypothetical protein